MFSLLRLFLHSLTASARMLRRLGVARGGNVAVVVAFAAIPIIVGAGMALDTARSYAVKLRLGAALDAAALAVGTEVNQTSDQLTTAMQNYFNANYASLMDETNVTITPVPGSANLASTSVTFQAQATVPTTFLQLAGINNVTVTVQAQTQKTIGIEVALVLDNTGSMLCGPNDGAPSYSDSTCANNVVSTDTTCTNTSNQSRICTLIKASTQFVNTLVSAISSQGQLYISVIPYVTTVNVGSALCSNATTCSHITTDSCSGVFTTHKGQLLTTYLTKPGTSTSPTPDGTFTGKITNASKTVTNIASTSNLKVGMYVNVTGNSIIPTNTVIKSIDSTTQITLCNAATSGANSQSINYWNPVTYDTTNTNTTANWMGCVVEPTSASENSGVSGVIDSATANPDVSEPSGGWPAWYPFWWPNDTNGKNYGAGINNWTSGTIAKQDRTTEIQGKISIYDTLDGPNQGCPVPMLPLTDVTTAAGKTAVLNTISSMWPRDAGGTQVHIGMIWGWRALSPNGPFTATNGHPLSYSAANTSGWKKVIVLMTDGTEEWPQTGDYTGLGWLADGKIGTKTSTSTAETNLNTRLQTLCTNMQNNGNFEIYTIGLGTDGASNSALQSCPGTTGGFFLAATPSNLQNVFNNIAKSMVALRLTQ